MSMIDEDRPYICHECVSDEFLKKKIDAEGKGGKCSYCEKIRKIIKITSFADSIHSVIKEHFYLTSNEPTPFEHAMLSDGESNYDWERHGVPVNALIQDIAGVDELVANDVQEYLSDNFGGDPRNFEENPYGDEACYEERPPNKYPFQESWDYFRHELAHISRFFSQAAQILDKLFSDIDSLRTFDGKSVIRIIGPTTEIPVIYRARVSTAKNSLDEILKDPVGELAAPPLKSAIQGRMNAAGISVFYGSTGVETCIAEVRPPVGSHVVVGRFQIIRDIRLLDLDILSKTYAKGSYFDPEFSDRKGHAAFLQHFVGELTKPIMPDDETVEYLATQVVAEYLAGKAKPRLDGIVFNSSQTQDQGQNIILFRNSCGVEPYKLPTGTTVSINYGWITSEDLDDSIAVFEELPKENQAERSGNTNETGIQDGLLYNRDITLRLDVNKDIYVMKIQGVKYESEKRYISRYRQ